MKKNKTDFFKSLGLKLRDCRRKRNFIFEDMPNITDQSPLKVMLLVSGKKELYNWSVSELWTYLDKMGYDLYIDAIPQKQEKTPLPPNTVLAAVCSVSQPASKTRNKKSRPTQKNNSQNRIVQPGRGFGKAGTFRACLPFHIINWHYNTFSDNNQLSLQCRWQNSHRLSTPVHASACRH